MKNYFFSKLFLKRKWIIYKGFKVPFWEILRSAIISFIFFFTSTLLLKKQSKNYVILPQKLNNCHQDIQGKLKFPSSSHNTVSRCLCMNSSWSIFSFKYQKQHGTLQAPQAWRKTSSATVQPCWGTQFLPVISSSSYFSPVAFFSLRPALPLRAVVPSSSFFFFLTALIFLSVWNI